MGGDVALARRYSEAAPKRARGPSIWPVRERFFTLALTLAHTRAMSHISTLKPKIEMLGAHRT